MGKNTKRIQAELEARVLQVEASLRRARPPAPDPRRAAVEAVTAFGLGPFVRPVDDWSPPRSRDVRRLTLAVARHLHGRYPTPAHLDAVWTGGLRLPDERLKRLRSWWMTVAGGGSLWKEHLRDSLSRKEAHLFLNLPTGRDLGYVEALWFAVARSYTDDVGRALRVARSKVGRDRDAVDDFRREAVRLFVAEDVTLAEIDDLYDYVADRRARDRTYSLKGRTVASLKVATEAWHRELARTKVLGGSRWDGLDVPDFEHVHVDSKDVRTTYLITQIRTGSELAAEGTAMRHCVSSYRSSCMSGSCSIWSLRRVDWSGTKRLCTIEVARGGRIVQVRGLANRAATGPEQGVVGRWASREGFSYLPR